MHSARTIEPKMRHYRSQDHVLLLKIRDIVSKPGEFLQRLREVFREIKGAEEGSINGG